MPCSFFAGFITAAVLFYAAETPCRIEIREQGTNDPVPLVELRTTHQQRFVSDNAGVIAVDSPELMNQEVWFDVNGYGYDVKPDAFGSKGVRLVPEYGKTLRIDVQRKNIAKRLGRLTGAGLFAESQKCSREPFPAEPETGVFGCDSVQNAVYKGRLFWIWGDTTLPHYPLGIFHATGATTKIRPFDPLKVPLRLKYSYFTDSAGKPRSVAVMPGRGPTWLSGLVVLPDKNGTEHLVAGYAKITPPLEIDEFGLCRWNDAAESFEKLRTVWTKNKNNPEPPVLPEGHASLGTDKDGKRRVLFGNPFPVLRCPASYEAFLNPETWERLTPQKTVRSAAGNVPVEPHTGSIGWSGYRKKWIAVFSQKSGKPAAFGEIWYAEADDPAGPWENAVKILSHGNYTFYNPRLHTECLEADSKFLLFEGTFSAMFADRPQPVPRYDYNQLLYRLDLDDPALKPASNK
ncbi:MAG: hypothetical protein LBH00_09780 [Planctomycetaceae bacterium]|jgi:hypothetical protein|nr:hypothetical protein [Planctomycetaceae bacterium]